MHNFKSYTLVILAILTMNGCVNKSRYNKNFVNKYLNENFDNFKNKGVVFRGYDQEQNSILFINGDLESTSKNGPYMVTIDSKTGKIKKTSCHLMDDSINFNRDTLNQLAIEFVKYKVCLLKVDIAGNVYVGFQTGERPNIIKVSNEKFIIKRYREGWKRIKDNWYEIE